MLRNRPSAAFILGTDDDRVIYLETSESQSTVREGSNRCGMYKVRRDLEIHLRRMVMVSMTLTRVILSAEKKIGSTGPSLALPKQRMGPRRKVYIYTTDHWLA